MNERVGLYFSADELRAALKQLGPTGDLVEALVATAAETLARIIEWPEPPEFEEGDTEVVWLVDHLMDPATARQSGRPHVELERRIVPLEHDDF